MHGKVFLKGEMLFLMVLSSGLEMEGLSRFGNTDGCLYSPKITSPILESMEKAIIDCLINPETRSWNHEMIDGIFIPLEVDLIKKINLSKMQLLTWFFGR